VGRENVQSSDEGENAGEEGLEVGEDGVERRIEAGEQAANEAGGRGATKERDGRGDFRYDAGRERCDVAVGLTLEAKTADEAERSEVRRRERKLRDELGHRRGSLVVRRVGLVRNRLCSCVSEEECTKKG
jgi:hypothetical protein